MINIVKLEKEINTVLEDSYFKLVSDSVKMKDFANIYRSEVEKGFYEGKFEAEGEFPGNRRPNKAFMKTAEEIWSKAEDYLKRNRLFSQKSLRELFKTSREYDLAEYDTRIFIGHLLEKVTGKIFALFVLYIPHDNPQHTKFNLPRPFYIKLLPIK